MQMLDVHFPTTDGRELIFTRHTEPDADQQLLLAQLGWTLPVQPPPAHHCKTSLAHVDQTLGRCRPQYQRLTPSYTRQLRKSG